MQLCEYFMWKYQKCGDVNRLATICGFLLLKLQQLFIVLGVRFFSQSKVSDKVLNIIVGIVSILFIIIVSITLLKKKTFSICSKPGRHKHLSWDHENLFNLSPKGIIWQYYYIYYYWFHISNYLLIIPVIAGYIVKQK